jgi:hypothetical protein
MLNVAVPKAKHRQIKVKTDIDMERQRKIVKDIERLRVGERRRERERQ